MREKIYLEQASEEIAEKYEDGAEAVDIGKFEKAEKLLDEVLEKDPKFVPAYNKLGVIEFYRKDLNEAEKKLKKANEIDEEFPPTITNLGSLAKERGDLDKARELYEKAIKINPEYGPAHNNLGVVYREQGEFGKSVKQLKKARKLGSYAVKMKDKPLYKSPGCLVPLGLVIVFGLLLYFWLT